MIEKLAKSIAVFLCKEEVINEEDKEVYEYGLEVMISNVLGIVLIILVGIVSDTLWKSIVFVLMYATLRVYTGGYHADTHFKCNLYFVITYLLTLVGFELFYNKTYQDVLWVGIIIGFLIVGALAPIRNENRSLTDKEVRKYRVLSIIIYLLFILVMIVIDINDIYMVYWTNFSLYIKIILLSIVVLMLLGLKRRTLSVTM